MQARGPVKNSPRANRATIASGTTEARIFKRNMTRYPLTISPRQGAYGWQRVKETSYRRIDAGCSCEARHPDCEWHVSGFRRMGGAQRYPSTPGNVVMGIAALHPSYADTTSRSRGADRPRFA